MQRPAGPAARAPGARALGADVRPGGREGVGVAGSVKTGIQWVTPPDGLQKAIKQYGEKALAAAHATVAHVGAQGQNYMRSNAPWHDRTGNARGGLFFAVDGFGQGSISGEVNVRDPSAFELNTMRGAVASGDAKTLILVFGHTMFYGVYLELDHGGAYAIVEPAMEKFIPVLKDALARLFAD
jgi:hypothetical protein